MTVQGNKADEIIARVLQAETDGVTFFEKAHALAIDPRVKEVCERILNARREHLRRFLESLSEAGLTGEKQAGAKRAGVYPIDDLQKTECYVCGQPADVDSVPDSCPRCGASRYAFEREISLRKAWEFAEAGTRLTLAILEEAEKEASVATKQILSRQIELEKRLLIETRKEVESSRR